jgi:hypothetical protein
MSATSATTEFRSLVAEATAASNRARDVSGMR